MTARSRTWKRGAAGIGALLVCGLAGVGLYTRTSYGRWSPFTPPDRFQFCGVRYYRAGEPPHGVTMSRAQAMRAGQATQWLRATTVGPAGWPVYRTTTWSCPESGDRNGSGHTMYLKIGADRYQEMDDDN